MSTGDEARHKGEELKGQAKEAAGKATGNEQWQAEGAYEQTKSKLKQAGEKVKEAFTDGDKERKDREDR
ncbi:CsbD family protein [Allosalinactinospora lopnorensis]|uniref:CsbD family protein n=1 Tax=Allosalinactinospora lopnorensis TaxID=1352348 RepID=UPI000623B9FE|nr:CsbD family protein [Allosalinactinospora lopnorensis]